jgi:bifunctional DNA-binding transcriptional regulator/antitoxin component of YhaV-PrlF toxin-antitoxin module
MSKIYKILGKRGRITLPLEIRQEMGFTFNDVVSFEQNGDTVVVRCEKVCDDCAATSTPKPKTRTEMLTGLLDNLTPEEMRGLLIHLTVLWAQTQTKGGDENA